ncbi:Hypothetical predicted protein, partial [Paramuricea clavata]
VDLVFCRSFFKNYFTRITNGNDNFTDVPTRSSWVQAKIVNIVNPMLCCRFASEDFNTFRSTILYRDAGTIIRQTKDRAEISTRPPLSIQKQNEILMNLSMKLSPLPPEIHYLVEMNL